MKGIYLTEEGKQAIEAKIVELEESSKIETFHASLLVETEIQTYKEILSSAMILPVVESWESVSDYITSIEQSYFPNGVIIIQSKQTI